VALNQHHEDGGSNAPRKFHSMETQEIVSIVLAVGSALVAALFALATSKIGDIQSGLHDTQKDLNETKLLIASDYVKKSELSAMFKEISIKLDKIATLELGMVQHYATKDDLEELEISLGSKLDKIFGELQSKADRRVLPCTKEE
jgi:hypothetical protein